MQKNHIKFINNLAKEMKIVFEQFLNKTAELWGEYDIELFRKEQSLKPLFSAALLKCSSGVAFAEMSGKSKSSKRRSIDFIVAIDDQVVAIELKYQWFQCGNRNAKGLRTDNKLKEACHQIKDFKVKSGNWNIQKRIAIVVSVPYVKWNDDQSAEKNKEKKLKIFDETISSFKERQEKKKNVYCKIVKLKPKNKKISYFEANYQNKKQKTCERYPNFIILAKEV